MSNSFYIVQTSDAIRDQYPENTASDFTMQLKSQLYLGEDWEVAMTRIIYPFSWQNVREHQLLHAALQVKWFALDINYLFTQWYLTHGQRRHTWYVEGISQWIERYLSQKRRDCYKFWRKSAFFHTRESAIFLLAEDYLLVGMLRHPRPWLPPKTT